MTLVFAAIDFVLRKFELIKQWSSRWDPRRLPSPARQAKQVRRSSSIAGIIINSLFILWWWNRGSIPYLMVSNTGAQIHFAPVVTSLYVPVLVIAFLILAQHWINLLEPDWRWLPPATGLVTSVLGLVVLLPLLGASPLISISEPGGLPLNPRDAAEIQQVVAHCVSALWLGIMIAAAIFAWRLLWVVWQSVPRNSASVTKNGMAHV